MSICHGCGKFVSNSAKYCPKCGSPLKNDLNSNRIMIEQNFTEKSSKKKSLGLALIFFLILILILILISASLGNNDSNVNNSSESASSELQKETPLIVSIDNEMSNQFESDNVVALKSEDIVFDKYSISIVGATLCKSTGDILKDTINVGNGIKIYDDGMSMGMQLGLTSNDKEIGKRDSYLSLYFKFKMNGNNAAQRDSIIPDFKIIGKDNHNDEMNLMWYSNEKRYINVDYPYALVLFKTYYDSETFYIFLGDRKFKLDSNILK